ncbi:unnamed protein product [Taenia asiatica]|uniref:DUF5734 domain-containing protein n=1 Tax=Taenia asiatica TaxID=60517 RepID=A0A0R3W7H5_TAEAS|nr:unnamed protein product [Taenia asiatica]
MEKPDLISDLLHLKCERRKIEVSEKVMEKRLKKAIRARPRSYTLQLYKDHIKLQGQREEIFLDKVKEVKVSKEHSVLVLSSESKDKAKFSLNTMKFKNANDYTNVLCSISAAMKAQKAQEKESDFQKRITETEPDLSKRESIENNPISPADFRLPRIYASLSTEWCGGVRNMQKFYWTDSSSVEQVRMEVLKRANRRQKEYRPAPTRSYYSGHTEERRVDWNEDSDYSSSFTSDFDLYFDSSDTESDTISSYHYKRSQKTCKEYCPIVPKNNISKEFIRDSLGNQVHILRPRVARPRSTAY